MNSRAARLAVGFITLIACLWLVAKRFDAALSPATALSAALLLAPYWAFGFGFGEWIRHRLKGTLARTLAPLLLMAPYFISAQFHISECLGMLAIVLAVSMLMQNAGGSEPGWRDWLVLSLLGISVDLHLFDRAWTGAGLNALPKLLLVDAGLYGYLVIRPISGIGFDLRLKLSDVAIGLREFLFFTPIAIALGFFLSFLHLHRTSGDPLAFAAGWLFTLFFVALPEELFFRGLMLNLLERRIGRNRALAVTSLLFGLAHFNKRAAYFNWRYVILAAIAGIFYGRAWLARRRLLASSITHTTVDTVWSIWLR
ncbi:MAG TPA: CPBP family intramembrane glutamic endopeptidase [Bryobacteraceae bacterium]|nr:CPBP family intramembrane glutamic endopeptidase [Bryobacteraceae bacterium]